MLPRRASDGEGCAESPTWPSVAKVYEDFATGARATSAVESLCVKQEFGTDISFDLWRFDLLGEPETCKHVCERTAGADIVVLAIHGKGDFPGGVSLWLDQ